MYGRQQHVFEDDENEIVLEQESDSSDEEEEVQAKPISRAPAVKRKQKEESEDEEDEQDDEPEEELTFQERLQLIELKKKQQQNKNAKTKATATSTTVSEKTKPKKEYEIVKKNKNAPKEVSSKDYVPAIRNVTKEFEVKKAKTRDPRFDNVSRGGFNSSIFNKEYAFVTELKQQEMEKLRAYLKANKDELTEDEFNQVQRQISKLNHAIQKQKEHKVKDDIKKEHYEKEMEKASASGKKPYFLSESKVKKIAKVKKFEELKTSGKLDKYMAKKRKRNKEKDHTMMPTKRARREK